MPHTNLPHPEERPEGARLEGPTTALQASLRCVHQLAPAPGTESDRGQTRGELSRSIAQDRTGRHTRGTNMSHADLLNRTLLHANAYLDGLEARPVGATVGAEELRRRLARPLPEQPSDAIEVIDDLVRDVDGGIVGSTGGRFFGWV